jgi:hypothetical protein
MDLQRPVPPQIEAAIKTWQRQALRLRIIHVVLLVSASAFSILTAAVVAVQLRPYFAVSAALSVGILSALDLGVKANGLRNAWRHMNAAMTRYVSLPTFTVEELIQAYEDAETLIGDLPSGPRPVAPHTGTRGEGEFAPANRSLQRVT